MDVGIWVECISSILRVIYRGRRFPETMVTVCLAASYHKGRKLGINLKAVPTAFWNMALCGLASLHGRFVTTFCFHRQCVWYVADALAHSCQTSRRHTAEDSDLPRQQRTNPISHLTSVCYLFKALWLLYVPHVAFSNCKFCPHSVCMLLVVITINSSYIPKHLSPAGLLGRVRKLAKSDC
jgi:hypothetical protein